MAEGYLIDNYTYSPTINTAFLQFQEKEMESLLIVVTLKWLLFDRSIPYGYKY